MPDLEQVLERGRALDHAQEPLVEAALAFHEATRFRS
jgi:hypothetical protein